LSEDKIPQFTTTTSKTVNLPPEIGRDIRDAMLAALKNPELVKQALKEFAQENPEIIKRVIYDSLIAPDEKVQAAEMNPNLKWVASNPVELNNYNGKYVAIKDGKVIGSGNTSIEAKKEARKKEPEGKITFMLVSNNDFGL
jgi:hypothetical protein